MSTSAKRQSILPKVPAGPKAPVNFSSSIVVAESAVLTGNHTINVSSESVIHPRAKLESSSGRITIGRRCIVNERSHVGAPPPPVTSGAPAPAAARNEFGVTLEDFVTVEIAAVIESGCTTIGEGTHVGVGTRIGKGAKVGKHCTITAKSVVEPGEQVPDFTVVYSGGLRRKDRRGVVELKNKAQTRQIEVLRKLIPSKPAKFMPEPS